jgi:hypothetical protein
MTQCASYIQDRLCCRAEHVNFARDEADGSTMRTTHCEHAAGLNTCTAVR